MDSHVDESSEKDSLYRMRHSLSHVLAQAVLQLRPGSTLGFGPAIADGFYYDFILSSPLTDEDLPELEKIMKHILKQNQKFEREELSREAALARLDAMGEPYKKRVRPGALRQEGHQPCRSTRTGPFLDMCEGPHVESTRKIPPGRFKLRSLAGAYWRGDSDNVR
jgi:threonyl-tRNA synthetase